MTQSRKRINKNYKKQQGLCYWCFLPMSLRYGKKKVKSLRATVDHLSERNGEVRDFVLAHFTCNCERQHKKEIPDKTFKKIRRVVMNHLDGLLEEWRSLI